MLSNHMKTAIKTLLDDDNKLKEASDSSFDDVDTDRSGYIEKDELGEAMESIADKLKCDKPPKSEIEKTFTHFDANGKN